ncbi:alpha/beta hydrolase [Microbispora sp. ATCC PTA-5024]|uniref:alpha/beta hydrolase n=1 Tax=Microbispora sp. ATCC PTA-5024 TaxID=316330 RepID=UPI0003DC36D5|nr:alpha/beta hydrolase [Microbispora sp. ATCC PTA-5024]ETK35325.1 dienelactone hydrolase [Microbispora sp. ATCC PTA-5024]
MTSTVRTERVTFSAAGVELVGELRLPERLEPSPAVALTGPFTGVKDQVTGLYAERLARAGLVTLAFDHRGFGESGGRRGHEDGEGKLADLRSAVGLLSRRAEVDPSRIGLVGVCLGGGYAIRAAAADPRVKAVAGIAGAYNNPAWFAERMGDDAYRTALGRFLDRYDEYLPAVAPDGGEAAMPGDEPYSYYGTSRSASTHWDNRVTWGSLHSLMTFDVLGAAPLLAATPLLVVHGRVDAYCAPELADALLQRKPGSKEMLWLDCREHIDLYDVEPHVTRAAEAAAGFLHRRL